MSLNKLSRPSTAPKRIHKPDDVKTLGIPGSALFYQDSRPLPMVSHGSGIYLWDVEGKQYLDGCSGAFSANLGHCHPRIIRRATAQMEKVSFAYRTQFESEPAQELADILVRLSPPELNRVFFVNSGSEAVETAIKLARQYWWISDKQGKQLVISRHPSYHGATLGALSCTSYAPLNIPFRNLQLITPKVSAPYCFHCPLGKEYPSCDIACAVELDRTIQILGSDNVAAFIAEPIGGATTGGAVPPEEYFPMVEKICHDNHVLLIIDDVLTGCGRTGTFYGFDHWPCLPDIVALSKGLSGGYTPIGACVSGDHIVQPVLKKGGFSHGHTYAGNPLSTAIAAEVVQTIVDDDLVTNAREMGTYMHERLRELRDRYQIIGDIRGRGLLAGVEMVSSRLTREPFPVQWVVANTATDIARQLGLIVYPRRSLYGLSGDHLLLAPPLIIDRDGVDELIGLFSLTLDELTAAIARNMNIAEVAHGHGTHDRYRQSDAVPDYAIGNIDGVASEPDANVTWLMQDPNLSAQAVALPEGAALQLPGTGAREVTAVEPESTEPADERTGEREV